jgi:hypothetical protein
MAEETSSYSVGDTWPPQRMSLADDDGSLIDLTGVTSATVFIRGSAADGTTQKISVDVEAISPPEKEKNELGEEIPTWNAKVIFATGDLAKPTSGSTAKVKVEWEPDKIQFFPNRNPAPPFEIVDNNE